MNLYNANGILVEGNMTRALQDPNLVISLGEICNHLLIWCSQ